MLAEKSVLVVGVGGLGCPAALALARAGVGRLVLADEDAIDATNLHRQILFYDSDIGRNKIDAACRRLAQEGSGTTLEPFHSRLLPENAEALARDVDLVLEGADNFATKFLAADASRLARRPCVQGAAVRFTATVLCSSSSGQPCYRCLFEDIPGVEAAESCEEAGVMGPVVGFAGALMAELALQVLCGDTSACGSVFTYDGKSDRLRRVPISPRRDCPLCGSGEKNRILKIDESRYMPNACAPI